MVTAKTAPAKSAKSVPTGAAKTKPAKEASTRGPIARRVDPNETANMAKVLKAVEKAGPTGVLQSALKTELSLHFPGWYYLQKLRDEDKAVLTTHNMRVYGTAKGQKFMPPAAPEKAARVPRAKVGKPAAGATKGGVDKIARKAGPATTAKPASDSTAKTAKPAKAAKAGKGSAKPAAPSGGAAAQAADELQ